MATHSSILAWRIPWTEDTGRLQSKGLQSVRHNLAYVHVENWGKVYDKGSFCCAVLFVGLAKESLWHVWGLRGSSEQRWWTEGAAERRWVDNPKGWRRRGGVMNELWPLRALSLETGGKDVRVGEWEEISVSERWEVDSSKRVSGNEIRGGGPGGRCHLVGDNGLWESSWCQFPHFPAIWPWACYLKTQFPHL